MTSAAAHHGRRVRRPARRESALEKACVTALADVPIEVRPSLIAWVDARSAEWDTRLKLSTEMTHHGLRWYQIEAIARKRVA